MYVLDSFAIRITFQIILLLVDFPLFNVHLIWADERVI